MSRLTRVAVTGVVMLLVSLIGVASLQAGTLAQASRPPRDDAAQRFPSLSQDTDRSLAQPASTTATADYGAWSKVVFQSARDGNWEIYSANGDGSGQVRLTVNPASDTYPRLNRGGTRIAFVSNRTGNYELFTMNPDGSGLVQLTSSTANEYHPAWSPDGSKIVFNSYRDGQAEIYVINANGTGLTRLTNHAAYDGFPAWSPDGTRIAFTSDRGTPANTGNRVWVMNADGSAPQQLTTQYYCQGPSWSPDGTRIAFDADATNDGSQEIWLMNADGSGQMQVYDPPDESPLGYPGLTDAWVRSWSPDGNFIAFTRLTWIYYQGAWYWYTGYLDAIDTASFNASRLVSTQGDDWYPDWQTLDISAPYSSIQPLPQYSRAAGTSIEWSGQDIGSAGIKNYDVQYRLGSVGTWMNWLTTASTSSLYTGTPGITVYFRSRARDSANNLEAWPAMAAGDASTTLYAWQFAGNVTDDRGMSLPHVSISITPTAINTIDTDRAGYFMAYLTATGAYTFTASHVGYGSLPLTSLNANADRYKRFYLPPLTDVIRNGGFEASDPLTGWTVGGSIAPMIITDSYTGRAAAFLSAKIEPTLGAPETTDGGSNSAPDMAVDQNGIVHVAYVKNGDVYYTRRDLSGTWITPTLISHPGSMTTVAVAVTGTVYVVWSDTTSVYYRELPPSGSWSDPAWIATGSEPDIAPDNHNGVYVAYQWEVDNLHSIVAYVHRLPNGTWTSPYDLVGGARPRILIDAADRLHLLAHDVGTTGTMRYLCWTPGMTSFCGVREAYGVDKGRMAVEPSGTVHLLWTKYDSTGYYVRQPMGDPLFEGVLVPDYHGYGDVAVDSAGNAYVANTDSTGAYFRFKSSSQSGFSSPTLVGSSTTGIPVIVVDQDDQIHIVHEAGSTLNQYHTSLPLPVEARSSLSQTVTIPADTHRATLSLMYRLNGVTPTNPDGLKVSIADGVTSTTIISTQASTDWAHTWTDLSAWAGQMITITIDARTTQNLEHTDITLDEISLGPWLTPVPVTVVPDQLDAWTSTVITVTGDNFMDAPQLHVGNIAALEVHWIDTTTLTATLPALAPGPYAVSVTNPGGQANVAPHDLIVGKLVYLPIVTK